MSKTIVIKFGAEANLHGAQWEDTLEIDEAEWNAMSEEEKDAFLSEEARDLAGFSTWWEVIE